ncbi:tetratricopeptide (TPR) repeat protein [Nakamurella sp. UYEF19]|uniref:hypothetical protein n=1 Tax=Nakamurella sp. UYEF19 TaxID=1756392 RepID=UPI0033938C46
MSTENKLDGARLDALWDFDDPAASAERFHVELSRLEPGSTAHAELRTQVARALTLQHLEQEALAELSAVEAEGRDDPQVRARLELERGRVDNSNGRAAAAVPHFQAAATAAADAGDDFLVVDALHMLAIADDERSDEWTRQALAATEASTDPRTRRWMGSLRNNYGWTLHDRGDFPGALEQFEGALTANQETGIAKRIRIAEWSVARALRSLGRFDEALAIQSRLVQGPEDGFVSEELGELLLATGRPDEAAPHFATAATLLSADPWFDEPDRLARLVRLGTVYQLRRHPASAQRRLSPIRRSRGCRIR